MKHIMSLLLPATPTTCIRRPRNTNCFVGHYTDSLRQDVSSRRRDQRSQPTNVHPHRSSPTSVTDTTSEAPKRRFYLSRTFATIGASNPLIAVAMRARTTLLDVAHSNSLKYLIAGVRFHSRLFVCGLACVYIFYRVFIP